MFAAIHIPDFPVAALVRSQADMREKALAVVEGNPPMQMVVAMNEGARQAGVETGMTRLQAQARGVEARPRSASQEASAHAALLDCAAAFSPRVEETAADTVMLDLAGLDRLLGPPQKIAAELARRLGELGLEGRVAVASNPDAAIHAARGFPGVTVIPSGREGERLGSLPVDVLQPPPEMLETLDRWGVRNLRALAALPEVAVTERLGQEGLRVQRLARGATRRDLKLTEPALHFEESLELEHPVEMLEPLAFLLGRLLEQLCARLGARALATNELRLELGLESQISDFRCQISDLQTNRQGQSEISNLKSEIFSRTLRLPVPMLDSKVFLKLLQLDLNAHPPSAPVMKVTLAAEPVRPRAAQGGLFLPPSPEPERLEVTLARIQGVVGEGNAGAAEVLDTHRPDGFRMKRFTVKEATLKRRAGRPPSSRRGAGATVALRVFRPPVRAMVETRSGCPARLTSNVRGLRGEIVWAAGPWRASGAWWTEAGWQRDEWDVALAREQGVALYRIYRDAASGNWFVQGAYD